MEVIVTDLDHTVADASWRDPLLGRWDEYHMAGKDDKPIAWVCDLLRRNAHYEIVAITARPKKWEALTVRWLAKYNILIDKLYMRADHDHRPSPEVKLEHIRTIEQPVLWVLEDRDDCVAAYRAAGYNVLQVHVGKREDVERIQATREAG